MPEKPLFIPVLCVLWPPACLTSPPLLSWDVALDEDPHDPPPQGAPRAQAPADGGGCLG